MGGSAHTIMAVISDTHFGGTTALATPKFALHSARQDETQIAEANKAQMWLYECWTDYWDYVKVTCGIRGKYSKHKLVVVHLGDVIEGVHHGSVQLMNEIADQINMACQILLPVVNMAGGNFYITYGTEAHSGEAGGCEAAIAKELGAKHDWEFCLDMDGILVDVGHAPGRNAGRPWTSVGASIAIEVSTDYLRKGQIPPDYVFRGHSHVLDDSGERVEGTRCICLPSWQLRTAFGHKVAKNRTRSDIGGLILNGNTLDLSRLRYKATPGQKQVIKV
jgi:hypothetical protein